MAVEDLRQEPMMAYLLDSLNQGKDIGHYGRLVFVMIGRHFMSEQELLSQLTKDPALDQEQAAFPAPPGGSSGLQSTEA